MFESLKSRWKVSGIRLTLIILTFAIGGSLTGYAGKKIMNLLAVNQDWLWTLIYIIVITVLWPIAVILVSVPMGQFRFFSKYLRRIGSKLGLTGSYKETVIDHPLQRIAIFASGTGSNAQKIIDHFRDHKKAEITLIVCNNPRAGVLNIAEKEHIPVLLIEKARFFEGDSYFHELEEKGITFIVLAGFLWKIPSRLVEKYDHRIINLHPALLPRYGGKGMYGHHVHSAVLNAKEKESGISIHYVDEVYDNGHIIFQTTCPVYENDTIESLSERIHKLEHANYPRVVEEVIETLVSK